MLLYDRADDQWSPVIVQMLPYDKGLLIHRKRSPFPDKGRLNVTRFVVLCIFICLYTIINKSSEAQTIPTSLPLLVLVAFVANINLRQMTEE